MVRLVVERCLPCEDSQIDTDMTGENATLKMSLFLIIHSSR